MLTKDQEITLQECRTAMEGPVRIVSTHLGMPVIENGTGARFALTPKRNNRAKKNPGLLRVTAITRKDTHESV